MFENSQGQLGREREADGFQSSGEDEMRLLRRLFFAVWRASFGIAAFALLIGVCAVALSYLDEVTYTATAKVKLYTRVETSPDFSPDTSGLPTSLTSLESELEVLRSTDLIERVIIELDLTENDTFMVEEEAGGLNWRDWLPDSENATPDAASNENLTDAELELAIARIQNARSVEQVGATSAVYAISMTSPNRYLAAQIANEIAREYLRTQTDEKLRSLELSQAWLADRTSELQTVLNDLSTALEAIQLESPFSPEEYATIKAQRLIALRDLRTINARQIRLTDRTAVIRALLATGDPRGVIDLIENPSSALVQQLSVSDVPDLALIRAELEAVMEQDSREQIALAEQTQQIQARIDPLRASQAIQGEHDAEMRRIENDIAVNEAIYRDFVSQLSRRTESSQYLDADASIIEIARRPLDPSSPDRKSIGLLTLLLAGLVGLGYVLYREIFETRLRTSDEIEDTLHLPLYGLFAHVDDANNLIEDVVLGTRPISPALMGYARRIQVSLDAALDRQGISAFKRNQYQQPTKSQTERGKIISGVAAITDEGLSTSLLLVARACAASGQRVLLLDCNFADSAYVAFAEKDSDLVRTDNTTHTKQFIRSTATPRLDILPASLIWMDTPDGSADFSAFFATAAFKELLNDLAAQYDKIFVDVPPVLATVDTVSILSLADMVLYFVRWNATSRKFVKAAVDVLRSASIAPAFAVVTQVRLDKVSKYGDVSLAAVHKAHKAATG